MDPKIEHPQGASGVWMWLGSALALIGLACHAAGGGAPAPPAVISQAKGPLAGITNWAIQRASLDAFGAIDALLASDYDVLVLEPTRTVRGQQDFAMRAVVDRLHKTAGRSRPNKLVLAYLPVAQAEDDRRYWEPSWRPPRAPQPSNPSFLLGPDPRGWEGSYNVAFWNRSWRSVLMGSKEALVDDALALGFDGIYLDGVLGYSDPTVVAAAKKAGVDPAQAMVDLISALHAYAQAKKPGFVWVAQDAGRLIQLHPELYDLLDAVVFEGLTFSGKATARWEDPGGAGLVVREQEREALAGRIVPIVERGLPVWTLD
ncbi:MAG TPA: endo alpha-1,4 polygalactosaminidase, partial [Planctomycetota bacterium]|nr:endo alpha-1,4 polygalactosaminidase [Planctomycetota bacterium]